MGMYAVLNALSDSNINVILATPELIGYVVYKEEPDAFFNDAHSQKKIGFFGKIFGKKAEPTKDVVYPTLTLTEAENNEVDLDKAWHGIHYCLTGDIGEGEHPLGFILYGGRLAGDIDVGYGPARLFTSSETKRIHNQIKKISSDDLKANYEPEKMDDVYPSVIWARTDEDNFEYIDENFSDLKNFLAKCFDDGLGMAVSIQ